MSNESDIRHAERNKRRGVSYAVTADGLELPVLDVTHSAFAFEPSDEQLALMMTRFLEEQQRFARRPRWLRRALSRFFLRGSRIGRGLRRAEGGFLDSMTTYLVKLGPENLGSYAVAADRAILRSLPARSVRLRATDMARLLADGLGPRLHTDQARPLYLINIGGGPALDSINALIVLHREQPQLLVARRITLVVLDRDPDGAVFGARALVALQAPGAALSGLSIDFEHLVYDWTDVSVLEAKLRSTEMNDAVLAVSSEGGLFEYGADEAIRRNLRALLEGAASRATFFVGSVTRDDQAMRTLKLTSTVATRPRGLQVFSALVEATGWTITRSIARPFSDQVLLSPRAHEFRG